MVAGLITAMSLGSIGIAQASQNNAHRISNSTNITLVDPDIAVLAKLVAAGTINQAQSTLILAALQAAHAVLPGMGDGMMGEHGLGGFNLKEDINVVTTTLGITVAQLQTSLAAGQTLATIAGVKTPLLIAALVASETTKINAHVISGDLTQAQATVLIAGLTATVTSIVNSPLPLKGFEFGDHHHGMGDGMMGEHGLGGFNLKEDINVVTTTLGITVAQLQTSLVPGQTLATIAGAKTALLITALVAAETTEINARVTSGELTQAQATVLIAGLTATVTTFVNSPLPVPGMGHGGNHEHGDHHHGMGGGMMGGSSANSGESSNN